MSDLVRRETRRKVTVISEVTATVRLDRFVTDSEVRKFLDMDPYEAVTADEIEDFLRESEDISDSEWDVLDFTDWGMRFDVELGEETSTMHAPPAFVPLPGMEGL